MVAREIVELGGQAKGLAAAVVTPATRRTVLMAHAAHILSITSLCSYDTLSYRKHPAHSKKATLRQGIDRTLACVPSEKSLRPPSVPSLITLKVITRVIPKRRV